MLRGLVVGCVKDRLHALQRAEPRAAEEQASSGVPSGHANLLLEQAALRASLPPGRPGAQGLDQCPTVQA